MAKKRGPAMAEMFMSLLLLKHQLNVEERDALLTELMAHYLSGTGSDLMDLLEQKDLPGFKKKLQEMNEGGEKIRQILEEEKKK